jgi:hypothetical protein
VANLLSWLNDNVRDVFDANTQKDQQKRIAAGQPRFYQDQQRQAPNVLNQVNNFANKAYENPMVRYNPMTNPGIGLTLANDVLKNPKGFVEGGKNVAKGLIANPVRLGKIINYTVTQKQMSDMLDRGEIDYNTYNKMVSDSANEAGIGINDDAFTVGRKVGGAVGGTALDVLTAGTMSPKYAMGLKTGQLGKAANYSAPLINKMAAGAGIGASMGAANTLQRDQLTAEQAAYDMGGGAILGGIVPAGLHGLGKAYQKLTQKSSMKAADNAIQARLANRPANLRAIEQNPTLDDAQRFALAQDPGQAGLKLPQAQRDAMLADFRAKIGTPKVGRPIANNVDPADLQGAALQSHLGKADLQAQQAADLAASKARAASPEVQQQALKIRHFQDPMKDLEIKRFDPTELKINRFEPPPPNIPVKRMTVPGINPKTGMGRIDLTDGPVKNTFDGDLPKKTVDLSSKSTQDKLNYIKNDLKVTYSDADQNALREYVRMDAASDVNTYLRTGKHSPLFGRSESDVQQLASTLNNTANKLKLPNDMVLHRLDSNFPANLKAGDIFTDKGFTSTSAVQRTANVRPNIYKLRITAKKGQPAINMSMSKEAIESRFGVNSQSEIILPAGTQYKVKSVNGWDVELEVIGNVNKSASTPRVGKPVKNTFDGPLPKKTNYHRQAEVEKSGLVNMSSIKDISEYSRAGSRLSDESVTYWEKQIKSGKSMPPIIINEAGEVLDGRHRLTVLKNLGVEDGPIIRLTKAQEAAIGPVKGQNLKPEYIIDTLLNDGKTQIKRPAFIPPPDMGTPMGQYEPRIPPGLDDGPSMLGKGRIGNDVPEAYLKPPKTDTLKPGQTVRSVDRDNVGKIVSQNSDGTYSVRFSNKEEGTQALVKLTKDQIVDAKAPKAPITEQGTANIVVGPPKGVRNLDIVKEDIGSAKANFYNRFDSIEKLVKKVELERGTKLKPSENPEYYVKQFLGGGGIANGKIDMELTPIIKQTKDFDGLRDYVVATRMNELAQRGISKRGDDMLTDLSKRVGPEEMAKFDKIAKELYAYQQKNLDELLEVGVLTPEQHANILAKNKSYIPFNRVIPDMEQVTTQAGQKIRVSQSPIKAIKGSDKDIIDPIESMIRNTYEIQAVVSKQKVLRSLTALAPEEFVPLKSTAPRNTPAIEMFVDGKRQKFETNKAISDALNSMNEERLNAVVRMMSLPAKMLRSGATSLNVAFALPNIVRDQLSAAVNSKYGGVPMYDFVSGLASVIKKDDSYKKWILSGADQASFFAQDRTTLSRGVQDITGGYKYKVGKLIKSPLELFRIAGEYSEKGSRVGVFKRAMKGAAKEGLTGEDVTLAAMRESREATIDFAQRGSKMKAYNALVPFLNARVQGTGKLMQSFKQRPIQTMAIGASIASVPAGVLYAYNTGDPEREKIYNEIPDYIKREYFVMVTGDEQTPFVKIPKGEVGKIFGNPVESFLASARADDPEWKSTAISIIDSFLPVGSVEDPQRFITDASPTAVAVPYQMMSNFDAFRKSPIISQFQKDLPPEQQYSNYNTETGKKIGDALNISPAMLEFGINGITGGLGRQALQVADMAQGVEIPRNEMPVASRFLGKEKDLRDSANEVYEKADKDRIAKARENFNLKKRFKEGDESALDGLDTTAKNRIRRAVSEDQIKETLNPREKALWSLSNDDLEAMAETDKDAQTVLGLKDSLKSETSKSSKKKSYQKIRVGKPPKVKTKKARKGRKAKVVKPNAKIESSIRRIASNGNKVKTGRLSTTVRRPKFSAKALPKIKAPKNYA